MAITYSVGDMLTKIRNASRAKHETVEVKMSKLHKAIVNILKEEGYIRDFEDIQKNNNFFIKIFLSYNEKRESIINEINSISTPSRRVYFSYKNMKRVKNGYGSLVVSTSKGVLTGKKAKEKKVGGELIFEIW